MAIDRATWWVYLEVRSSPSARDARAFMKCVVEKAPIKVQTAMFDNAQALKDAAKSARLKLRKSVSE